MILDSASAVLGFFLLLAPGLVWERQQARHSPPVKESAFYEASRTILASSLATVTAAALLSPWWWTLYKRAAASEQLLADSVGAVPYFGAALVTSVLACVLTLLAAWWRWRKARPSIHGVPVWHRVFVEWRGDDDLPPVVIVELTDGTAWKGRFAAFDTGPEDSQRDLALRSPLLRRRPGEKTFTRLNEDWEHIVLSQPQICSIRVAYPKPDLPPNIPTAPQGIPGA
ncbi:DUF6338 family protein [Brachybacterium sp. UNK5269]|uniref:DUF6338 family protein n=1 Tax=Brachybacterium sp. UNK5269 TaxID=3408576 RepID=UPI003BAF30D9